MTFAWWKVALVALGGIAVGLIGGWIFMLPAKADRDYLKAKKAVEDAAAAAKAQADAAREAKRAA